MNNPVDRQQERPQGRRNYYAIAFAFGLGLLFGAALTPWITAMLAH